MTAAFTLLQFTVCADEWRESEQVDAVRRPVHVLPFL